MTITDRADRPPIEIDPEHAEALTRAETLVARVRYACEHQSPPVTTQNVRDWLAAYGYPTSRDQRSYVSRLVNAWRAERGIGDTADHLALTPERLAELDEIVRQAEATEPAAPPAPAAVEPRRRLRAVTVAAFAVAATATIAGTVAALHGTLTAALSWPLGAQITSGVAALVALVTLVWSGTSIASTLAAGRTARDVALDVASWAVALIAGFLAASGQVAFARWAHVNDWKAYLVPGILEPSVVVLLLLANRRVQKAVAGLPTKPIGKLLTLAGLLGGFAVYTNVVHAPAGSGLVFGAATTIGLILWWVKLQDTAGAELIDDAPQSKRKSRRTARYRMVRWVILPGQTSRAWLLSLDYSIDDAEIGLDLARLWRRDYDTARSAEHPLSRRLARREASRRAADHLQTLRAAK